MAISITRYKIMLIFVGTVTDLTSLTANQLLLLLCTITYNPQLFYRIQNIIIIVINVSPRHFTRSLSCTSL